MKNYRSTIVGFAVLVVLMTAGAAQSLSGSNTVFTDDIVNGHVTNADLGTNSVTGGKVYNNTLTNADINESSLVPTCTAGMTLTGDVCYTSARTAAAFGTALGDCADEDLRLPTLAEGKLVAIHSANASFLWTDNFYFDGGVYGAIVVYNGGQAASYTANADLRAYRCVTTVGARP